MEGRSADETGAMEERDRRKAKRHGGSVGRGMLPLVVLLRSRLLCLATCCFFCA